MRELLGYVVVMGRQVGTPYEVLDGTFYEEFSYARDAAEQERRRTAQFGRRDTFAVAEVTLIPGTDGSP